jgi:hypothetical protein
VAASDNELNQLVAAIVEDDTAAASKLLAEQPRLATAREPNGATRQESTNNYFEQIRHYIYGGDTALHMAAAGYRVDILRLLLDAGADVSAANRRGAQALHYAADGSPGYTSWNPDAQAQTIAVLIAAGADPNALDKSGVAPLHRAVRTRAASAVSALIDGGADPQLTNKGGSTPWKLATMTTGRGGSGSPPAKQQQEEIVRILEHHGATQ